MSLLNCLCFFNFCSSLTVGFIADRWGDGPLVSLDFSSEGSGKGGSSSSTRGSSGSTTDI